MNDNLKKDNFFSVGSELVLVDIPLPYDLYINSSTLSEKERFVRIFPKGDSLTKELVAEFKTKYFQLYVRENQRDLYLKSLVKNKHATDVKKVEVIKDSAIHYLGNLFDPAKEFSNELLVDAIDGCRESVESMVDVVQDYDVHKLQELIGNLSFHDFYTYDHSINVSMYCISIYRSMKPESTRDEIVMAGLGGLLHDLGKIKIPTNIINKPDKLNDLEFQEIKNHPVYGKEILDENKEKMACSCEGVDFKVITRIVHEHHENFNGTGYPANLKGDDIHLLARVTAIADFFDAITTKRAYHEALTNENALEVMQKTAGKKIDPTIFEVFTKKVHGLVFKGKGVLELEDNFDPCQPHQALPFKDFKAKKQEHNLFEKEKDFGKVQKTEPEKNPEKGPKKKAS